MWIDGRNCFLFFFTREVSSGENQATEGIYGGETAEHDATCVCIGAIWTCIVFLSINVVRNDDSLNLL